LSERWLYLSFVVPLILVISVNLVLQWFVVWGWANTPWQTFPFTSANLVGMWCFGLVPPLAGAAAVLPFYPAGDSTALRVVVAAACSIMAAALRFGAEYAIWGPAVVLGPVYVEVALAMVLPFSCIMVSMQMARSQVRSVRAERRLAELEFRAVQAALERENAELRVRREVSAVLHDRIQQRLVYAAARLHSEVLPLAEENDDRVAVAILQDVIADIDRLREDDVRSLSHSLFPPGADLGLHQAIALALAEVPASVRVEFSSSAEVQAFDAITDPRWDVSRRAVFAEVLGEAITNALKHGQATAVQVDLRLDGAGAETAVVKTVTNDGVPAPADPPLSGLASPATRAQLRGGGLSLGRDENGRTRLTVWLPTAVSG
jgi:signal transduction histidine kinase